MLERERLQELLKAGWSYERIARDVGMDAATVAGLCRRFDLVSTHVARAAPKGPLVATALEALLADGLTIRAIASKTDRSPATVRHWMRRYGLAPAGRPAPRRTLEASDGLVLAICAEHGETKFARRSDGGVRCLACRSAAVVKRRRKVKQILVAEAGGACARCGYDRCIAALQFHHVDRRSKRFTLSRGGAPLALSTLRDEADKCVLLCANCHAEAEHGCVDARVAPPASSDPE